MCLSWDTLVGNDLRFIEKNPQTKKQTDDAAKIHRIHNKIGFTHMMQKVRFLFQWLQRKAVWLFFILVVVAVLTNLVIYTVKFNITGSYEGIFLLKGEPGALYEVKDDLYLGEGYRYIWGIDFEGLKHLASLMFNADADNQPHLEIKWNSKAGNGFIRNYLTGGKQLITCFSRYIDDAGKEVSGLFVGGGLPANVLEDDVVKMNETGMAFYNGVRWYHIWCNVNEAIFTSDAKPIYPSTWKYLRSSVLHQERKSVVLVSSHEVILDGQPLHIDRYAYFRAGAKYFVLQIVIRNVGKGPATYYYVYSDEPWLGNYGTSGGNVGWSGDGLHQYVGTVNSNKYNYAGLFDYGNDAIGEGHHFTMTANFLAWFGSVKPAVYFSNGPSEVLKGTNARIPLSSNERFIAAQWGPRTLPPGQSEIYTLAIGMADRDPNTGFPVKPNIDLKNFP
jgi:hypothetical protein